MKNWIVHLAATYVWGKEWSIYPFIPPIFSLLLSLFIIPRYDRLLNKMLLTFLKKEKLEANYELVKTVISARTLQIAYLTEVPVFAVSVIAAAQSNYPILLVCLTVIGLLLLLLISPKVFLSEPDYLATTEFPETPKKGRLTSLNKRGWTQLDFYSTLLVFLNLFFLIIITITLPAKRVN